jgi:hypothetical protein
MVVFAVAGIVCLAALALPWYGPVGHEATAMLTIDWYYIAVEVTIAITLVGLLVVLIRALVTPKVDSIIIDNLEGGQITVSRDAIASQASHIVEADGTCQADDVEVRAKKKGDIRVKVRVLPYSTVDVTAKASELHDALTTGLAALCADKLKSVSLEFLEPQTPTDVPDPYATPTADAEVEASETPSFAADPTGDITVPLHDERTE